MAIEAKPSSSAVCFRCGKMFGSRTSAFFNAYGKSYVGIGKLHVCKDCTNSMYKEYLSESCDPKLAIRQLCRKLDLYWNEDICDMVLAKTTPNLALTPYLSRINSKGYVGKCYDDSLKEENAMWDFEPSERVKQKILAEIEEVKANEAEEYENEPVAIKLPEVEITDDIVMYWGTGYTKSMYSELEQRKKYWLSRLPDDIEVDIGTEAYIKQICALELDINRDRADGKSVDKAVNTLNTLLGSMNIKPTQKKQEEGDSDALNKPLGVWLYRYENERPLPEIDEEFKDVNGIIKYIMVWCVGHLSKMMGMKNRFSKMYDAEIERLRVENPAYADEDTEDFLDNVLNGGEEYEQI